MKITGTSNFKKSGLALLIFAMSMCFTLNTQANQPTNQPEAVEILVEIEGLKKQFPTIILVDKELKVKAEFYGDEKEIKKEFAALLEKTELLLEHNSHRIYLITK